MNVRHNTILITGGTSGIGKALADLLADYENQVIVCGKTMEKTQHLPPNVTGFCCDLSHSEGVKSLQSYLLANHCSLNILINNAATLTDWNVASEEAIEAEIYLNLTAPLLLSRFFVNQIDPRKENTIINISSKASLQPMTNFITYSVSKRGLSFFSTAMRCEVKDKEIKVFDIIPPAVKTNLFDTFHQKQNHGTNNITYVTPEAFALLLVNALEKGQENINFITNETNHSPNT